MRMSKSELSFLKKLFAFAGLTYPSKTLERRVELLRFNEFTRFNAILGEIEDRIEKLDGILANAAEENEDKWP